MTTYTWPTAWQPQTVQLRLMPSVRTFTSPYNRSVQAIDLMAEVWRMQIALPPGVDKTIGGAIEAFFDRLKGPVNTVSLWHFARPAPLGTMRGSPTLAANAAQLANTINISGSGTLLAGDMISVGGQLCRVMADATSGLSAVEIAPRLRAAKSSGAAIVWDKPTANFMLMSDGAPVVWQPGVYDAPDVEFIEVP